MAHFRMTFAEWMAKVDAIIMKKFGLDSRDLIDWDYHGAFEDGYTPSQAVREAIASQ
jgi:Family of unknown function (DUF5419)